MTATALDIQNVVLWIGLNRQLVALRKRSPHISQEGHDRLLTFCATHRLFDKVRCNPLMHDIPLALVTDLKDRWFLTYKGTTWLKLVEMVLPGVIVLDVSRALGYVFRETCKLDEKFQILGKHDRSLDADETVTALMQTFLDISEESSWDYAQLIHGLYGLKAQTFKKLLAAEGVSLNEDAPGQIFLQQPISVESQALSTDVDKLLARYSHKIQKLLAPCRNEGVLIRWTIEGLSIIAGSNSAHAEQLYSDLENELRQQKQQADGLAGRLNMLDAPLKASLKIIDSTTFAFMTNALNII